MTRKLDLNDWKVTAMGIQSKGTASGKTARARAAWGREDARRRWGVVRAATEGL